MKALSYVVIADTPVRLNLFSPHLHSTVLQEELVSK